MVHLRGRQEGASHDHSLANDSNGSRGAPRYDRTQAIRRPLLPSESLDSMKDTREPVLRTLSALSLEGSEGSGSAAQPAAQAKRKGRFNIVAEEASDGAKVTPPWSTDGLLSHTSTEPL